MSTRWEFNGKELSGMDHRELVQEGRKHKLVIKQPTASDSGTYSCHVKNEKTFGEVVVKSK